MKLIILAAYPVQYHAPVFREISRQLAQNHHECLVIYLSKFSIQGYLDQEFGTHITWDEPLLAGYRSLTLNSSRISQPLHFFDLKSPGWKQIIQQEQPTRLLVTNLNYQGMVSTTIQARLMGIPCTLRVETNDLAFSRTKLKDVARKLIYQNFYRLFDSAIAIGSLNREHLIGHGISSRNIEMSYYCVPNRFQYLQSKNKQNLRQKLRQQLGFNDEQTVILFSGKLISKKNPQLLLEAASIMPENKHRYLGLLYLGSGYLEASLKLMAESLPALKVHFAGFKNQQELPPYYLAADALVIPSNREGETWGLVVNEALQAGLPCIVTNAVGCSVDFRHFPEFQIIAERDADALAKAIEKIMQIPRIFERYDLLLKKFSIEQCSQTITSFILRL